MLAVVGESLIYEASRVIREDHRLSYYQYRALSSFTEMLVLHDAVLVVAGVEKDSAFLGTIDWLRDQIGADSDFTVQMVSPDNREQYINNKVIQSFESICQQIYQRPLPLVTGELLEKQSKDRTAEDMSERIERIFSENYPTQENRRFIEELLRLCSRNATSSELRYFFRSHLLQAIADNEDATCLFENQRLIAEILHHTYVRNTRLGTLAYSIYALVNELFQRACEALPHDKSDYPRPSLLVSDLIIELDDRHHLLPAILKLRKEFQPLREHYKTTERALLNQNTSLFERSEIQAQLEETVTKVWIPTISSLGRGYRAGNIRKFLKNIFGKYGFGDLTVERSETYSGNDAETSDSVSYGTPSLVGIGTAIAQTMSDVYQEWKLYKPNKPLLECLARVVKSRESLSKLKRQFPVVGFAYQINQILDRAMLNRIQEVAR
jgi:hypothetical protein